MLESFHFIRPLWLLALLPLALLAWRVHRPGSDNPWRHIVDARLLPLLLVGGGRAVSRALPWLVAAGWVIAVLALADPTWERKPQPVYQTMAARVVVLELSRSMDAADLKPSRLVRARYKVEDVLDAGTEGQTGLVVYAGDAFTVTPLTRDANTIRAQLKVLEPGIMPVDGSRADLGLLKAGELLRQAGASSGQVLLIADGVEAGKLAQSQAAAARLRSEGYRVSVLGVGTEVGAPLPGAGGEWVRDAAGRIALARLDVAALQSVAQAGGGKYRSITDNGAGLRTLLADGQATQAAGAAQTDAAAPAWKEQGPLLAVLLLPLAALAFRRNWLLGVALLAGLAAPPRPAIASTWDDLWRRPEQQAAKALEAGDYAKASALATDAYRRGSAEYRAGHYRRALDDFQRASGADADYNRGNTLARLGRYQEAIAAYDKALEENPGNEDARVNKAAVAALLRRQPQASNPQQGNARKDQSQNHDQGGGQNSPQGKAQDQASQQARAGQSGAASGQGRQAADANKPNGGAQAGAASGGQGEKNQSRTAASGKDGRGQAPGASDSAQQKPSGTQFAEAAQKLAAQQARAQASASSSAPATAGAQAAGPAQAGANAKRRRDAAADSAQALDSEERLAAQQWLRRIPDDPGGLLRRKFLYQYRQRVQQSDAAQL